MNTEITTSSCSCGSGNNFSGCCEPLLHGIVHAQTAEQLMRSRYSAYAHGYIDYLLETTHVSERKYHSRKEIQKWAKENNWLKLEIVAFSDSTVEFKAFFTDKNAVLQVHHEKSTFRQEKGKWYFVNGVFGGSE